MPECLWRQSPRQDRGNRKTEPGARHCRFYTDRSQLIIAVPDDFVRKTRNQPATPDDFTGRKNLGNTFCQLPAIFTGSTPANGRASKIIAAFRPVQVRSALNRWPCCSCGGVCFLVGAAWRRFSALCSNRAVDIHAGAQLETGRFRQARHDGEIPVKMRGIGFVRGERSDDEIERGVLQRRVEPAQNIRKQSRQIIELTLARGRKTGRMPLREYPDMVGDSDAKGMNATKCFVSAIRRFASLTSSFRVFAVEADSGFLQRFFGELDAAAPAPE